MAKIRPELTLEQMVARFPDGFAVSPGGSVFEVIGKAQKLEDLPALEPGQGYLIAKEPEFKYGDDRFVTRDSEVSPTLDELEENIDRLIKEPNVESDKLAYELYAKFKAQVEGRNLTEDKPDED